MEQGAAQDIRRSSPPNAYCPARHARLDSPQSMIRSLAFTTQGRLHSTDLEPALLPTLLADTNLFLWVDLDDPTQEETKLVLESVFHFHPLSIEDCVTASPSPKVEEYSPREGDLFAPYLFNVVHGVKYPKEGGALDTLELDFFLGANFLVTYHTTPLQTLDQTRESALHGTLHVARAPDRLAHMLLDLLVDSFNPVLDRLTTQIADLEQMALRRPDQATLNQILQCKKRVARLREIIGPEREVLARFARGEFKLIRPHLVPYFRDVCDALVHIAELAQRDLDSLTSILQVYLNMSSNRTGEVVKLLTLITVITTPLMMVGTWYGMNFKDMPELEWRHGYLLTVALTLLATLATYTYFKRKNWF
jgi:magnesium transporter